MLKVLYFLIVNYNSADLISRLLESVGYKNNFQAVIVNNSPEDENIANFKSDWVHIIEPQANLGFGRACNLGLNYILKQNSQAIVWLLNPDAYFDSDQEQSVSSIDKAIAFFQNHPQISILGTTVYNAAGELTSAGGKFTPDTAALEIITNLPQNLHQDYIKTDWVSGCSLLINLANFQAVPQFCDRFFLYYEDLDFCLRYSQQGHQVAVTHLLKVFHDTSTITNRNLIQKYRHITQSYLIHIEKYGSKKIFIVTNLRMILNTIRLLILKPKQGLGKAIGIYEYWQNRIAD